MKPRPDLPAGSGRAWRRAAVRAGLAGGLVAGTLDGSRAEAGLADLSDALTFSSGDGSVRAQVSGTVELAGYWHPDQVSDTYFAGRPTLVAPGLSLNLDAQLGSRAYGFAQVRLDRGFDPADHAAELRLDQIALRLRLAAANRLGLQAGKFATVVGNWTARHAVWDNPFVNAPLPYDNLTGVWDTHAAPSADVLLAWAHVRPASAGAAVAADKGNRLPIIWGPAYGTGVALAGSLGRGDYAFEVKNAAISSRPEYWNSGSTGWGQPAVNGRLGWRPDERWNLGLSFSRGEYLSPDARALLPPGVGRHDYRELVLGHDVAYAWHHVQVWGEVYAARFEIPRVGRVDTLAWYVEAKYKFTPQLFGAVRWNQQRFGDLRSANGQDYAWGRDATRVDLAAGYRFTAETQVKLQYSVRHERPSPEGTTQTLALQFVLRF